MTIPAVSALTETIVEAGATEIVTHDRDWFDTARNRAVPVRLYLPAQTPAQTLPLVSHQEKWGVEYQPVMTLTTPPSRRIRASSLQSTRTLS